MTTMFERLQSLQGGIAELSGCGGPATGGTRWRFNTVGEYVETREMQQELCDIMAAAGLEPWMRLLPGVVFTPRPPWRQRFEAWLFRPTPVPAWLDRSRAP